MSRVDTAWLRMERATNPMMITGVLMFAEPMSLEGAEARGQAALPRLRALPPEGGGHARRRLLAGRRTTSTSTGTCSCRALPGKGGKRALERFVSQLASTPLDTSRPLWQFHLVERYDGGSALVARIHHSYADGIALVQVLLSLTDTSREPVKGSDLSRPG